MTGSTKSLPHRSTTAALITSALFTALIAVLAQVAVPLPFSPIPLTGQVVGVLLAAALLDRRSALLCVTAYLLLGAAGAPVFSMARGGFYILTGPSGGYLWGFIPAVFCVNLIIEKTRSESVAANAAAMLAALLIIYTSGLLQLNAIMGYTLIQGFLVGIAPFIPLDLLKVALAAWLSARVSRSLNNLY